MKEKKNTLTQLDREECGAFPEGCYHTHEETNRTGAEKGGIVILLQMIWNPAHKPLSAPPSQFLPRRVARPRGDSPTIFFDDADHQMMLLFDAPHAWPMGWLVY